MRAIPERFSDEFISESGAVSSVLYIYLYLSICGKKQTLIQAVIAFRAHFYKAFVLLKVLHIGCLGGVVVRMSDLRRAVVGSNPGYGIAGFSEVGDHYFRVNYLGM